MCPLCSWERSAKGQAKIKASFDRIVNPQFLTLTIPSIKRLSKSTFRTFRAKMKRYLKDHASIFSGGIYAIETTYNREEKSWHVHAHVMIDAAFALPSQETRVKFAGRRMFLFTYIKLRLEYDWTRLWVPALGKRPRKNASDIAWMKESLDFECWVLACRANVLKQYRAGRLLPIVGLAEDEIERRMEWNRKNRRVIWITPVEEGDRDRAAKEVLKYITKSADFCDLPGCVKAFYYATKGTRLIQTFGTWYAFDVDVLFDTEHMDDFKPLQCACGLNDWVSIGTFNHRDVQMLPEGGWVLRRPHDHHSCGTVPRPTIRALESRKE